MSDPNEQLQAPQPEGQQSQAAPEAAPQPQASPAAPQAAPQQQADPSASQAAPQSEFDKLMAKQQSASQGQSEFDKLLSQHKAAIPVQATATDAPKKSYTERVAGSAYDSTIGAMAGLGKQLRTYYANNPGKAASNTALGPIAMLTDALTDPEHPIHQMATNIAKAHVETANKAYEKVVEAEKYAKSGDYKNAWLSFTQAQGYGFGAALPVIGPAATHVGENLIDPSTKQVSPEALGEGIGLVGSLVAPELAAKGLGVVGKGVGKILPKSPRPTSVPIAGETVPVSSLQAAQPGAAANTLKPFASAEGAQKMINDVTQPAAVKATISNLGKSVVEDVNPLRQMRGEQPLAHSPHALQTVDDVAQLAKEEAQKTYRPLDNVVHSDTEAWEAKVKEWEDANPAPTPRPKASPSTNKATAASKQYEAEAFKAEKQAWTDQKDAFDTANPKPKTFTQLQDQIIKAERDVKLGSQVDAQKALENIPKYKAEMKAFTNKHADIVAPDELDSANALYRKSKQYEFIADKINPVLRGTEGTVSPLKHVTNSVNLDTLESLPGKMKVEFGSPANPNPMSKLLGEQGMNNYNTVIEALKNPISGKENLLEWAVAHQAGLVGQTVGVPIKYLANKLLFDPEFGSMMVKSWRAASGAGKIATTAAKVVAVTHRYNPETKAVEPFPTTP